MFKTLASLATQKIPTTILLVVAVMFSGCSASMKPENFANKQPRFVIEDYFTDKTKAWGIFEDRFGNLKREFVVDIKGSWDGKQLIWTSASCIRTAKKKRVSGPSANKTRIITPAQPGA